MRDATEVNSSNQSEPLSGADIWLIRANLALSYEARVAQHQNTLDCVAELQKIKEAIKNEK